MTHPAVRSAVRAAFAAACSVVLAACGDACRSRSSTRDGGDGEAPTVTLAKEQLPRCRADGPHLAVAGEDVAVGDAVVTGSELWVGVARRVGGKRVASVLRVGLDLARASYVELGPARGDDPPPRPFGGPRGEVWVAWYAPTPGDAGAARTRVLEVRPADPVDAGARRGGSVVQAIDESLAFDVAAAGDSALVAWDEDAPPGDRGVVKVQLLGAAPRAASPDGTDAESPRLAPREGGGYWLAWLARRPEAVDASTELEGPGESRTFRWVEVRELNAAGEPTGDVMTIGGPTSHTRSFELTSHARGALVVTVDDAGGTAAYAVGGAKRVVALPEVDGGVGKVTPDLVPLDAGAGWLAWADEADDVHLVPLFGDGGLGPGTDEPALAGARMIAAYGEAAFALGGPNGPSELRRFVCK
ncbi:MAG: hypothetical protein KC657_16235 [Myxococcales bacterium]|nr:hypothetical protein [Myxococcales bacterium]